MTLIACRSCQLEVDKRAPRCRHCGVAHPASRGKPAVRTRCSACQFENDPHEPRCRNCGKPRSTGRVGG